MLYTTHIHSRKIYCFKPGTFIHVSFIALHQGHSHDRYCFTPDIFTLAFLLFIMYVPVFLESSVKFLYYLLVTLNDVSTITCHWLAIEGIDVRFSADSRAVSCPNRLWGPHSFLFSRLCPLPYSGRSVNMITHRQVLLKLRISGAMRPTP